MIQNLYYHVFGTAREKSLDGTQDNPIFWRSVTPISWDENPFLVTTGGINQFDQVWKIKTKYGQEVDIYPIAESQYTRESISFSLRYNGEFVFPNGVNLKRTCPSYSPLSSPPVSTKLAYNVEIVKVALVISPSYFPVNPYPLNNPDFPIVPDKDYQTEIQFSNFEYDNTGRAEQRIIEWTDPIRIFNLSRTALQSDDLNNLLDFHETVKGAKGDFLYCDLSDFEVTKNPKILENGVSTQGVLYPNADGIRTEFILTKKYSCEGNIHHRPILYPDRDYDPRTFIDNIRPIKTDPFGYLISVNSWARIFFKTGNNNEGYNIGSVTLRLRQVNYSPNLFVKLGLGQLIEDSLIDSYPDLVGGFLLNAGLIPEIANFTAPSGVPETTSNVTFNSSYSVHLNPNTIYCLIVGINANGSSIDSFNGQYVWAARELTGFPLNEAIDPEQISESGWSIVGKRGTEVVSTADFSGNRGGTWNSTYNYGFKFNLNEYPSTPKIYQGNTLLSGYSVTPDRVVFNLPPNPGTLTWEGTFKTLCHFEEDKLDYQPIVKTVNGSPTTVNGLFSVPKLILRESRIEPSIIPPDIFNDTINHDFALNLTKQSTISPQFETNIITLSSGERKRYSRRNTPADINSLQQRKTLEQKDIEYLVCLWLCAKGSGATFRYPDLVNNLSVVSRFNSQSLSYQNQTSLRIYSLGELQIRRFSEGIVIDSGTNGILSDPVLTLCRCILIELTDGQKLGYTNFSRDLTIDNIVFKSRQAFDPTALERKLGIESDNEEMRGAFSDNITENLIFSDRFQEAKIITAVVDWRDLPSSLLSLPDEQVQIGYIGEITSKSGETYTLENLTEASIKLRQSRDEKTSPSCRWFFGQDNGDGTGCRKIPPTYTTYVASVGDRRSFDVYGDNFATLKWGKCTFIDGKNKSATYSIYQTIQQSGQRTRIELFTGAADSIAAHDKVILAAGCERTYNACRNDWNNTQNFGGIPSFGNFMKGNDFYLAPPRQS
jgi:uncharacterized phage protein (TIGR02218 family)